MNHSAFGIITDQGLPHSGQVGPDPPLPALLPSNRLTGLHLMCARLRQLFLRAGLLTSSGRYQERRPVVAVGRAYTLSASQSTLSREASSVLSGLSNRKAPDL
jgi:hypothetical protein